MSEPAPPGLANDAPVRAAPALTPEAIAAVLADFQAWLTAAVDGGKFDTCRTGPAEVPIDMHTLLGQFVALRHEVNLQTRATRAQQEHNAETLRQLTAALEALAATPQAAEGDAEGAVQPLLKTLVDLHDALTVGGREIGRVQEVVTPLLQKLTDLAVPYPLDEALLRPPPAAAAPSGWRRWFGGGPPAADDAATKKLAATLAAMHAHEKEREQQLRDHLDRVGQMLASLAVGYTMSLQRVERALQQHGLEPMAVVGMAFDPERMEVLDVVHNSGRAPGEVVEEVRRGYVRNGRVFRYAQVRVVKS
jgi:molecular chaperone GrpE